MNDDEITRARELRIASLMRQADQADGYVWGAFYYDSSAVAVFAEEIEALRYALDNSMHVVKWPYGLTIGEAQEVARELANRPREAQ